MRTQGYLAIHLHAHLPFVRHPEHESFLEEDWLFEAITECYLPLISEFQRLVREGVPFRLSMSLTPTLLTMLGDDLLTGRYLRYLDSLVDLAGREVKRTRGDSRLHALARMYLDRFRWARKTFETEWSGDLVRAFRLLQDSGGLQLITSAATHAFLPYLQSFPLAVRAQVWTAVKLHHRVLGTRPSGIWLPECGYYEGLDAILRDCGLQFFFTDAHGILHADPRPVYGIYAPVLCPTGPAAFGRDGLSSRQVWSAEEGYPGDPWHRDYYRDIGYDLDLDYLRPFMQKTGLRKRTGIKYHRITGRTDRKELYQPAVARKRALEQAQHFVAERIRHFADLQSHMGGKPAILVCPYDAELFGHWWYEGPAFLSGVFRAMAAQEAFRGCTVGDYLAEQPLQQLALPCASSWGHLGHGQVWLDDSNDWVYPHLHWATAEMIRLAADHADARGWQRRLLNQAARELMLAQASDWAFIMNTGTAVEYADRRTCEHVEAFRNLHRQIRSGKRDAAFLRSLEDRHNLFPDMDYRVYREDHQLVLG